MMRHFIYALSLMAGLTTMQAQTARSLEEIGQQWPAVTIRDVNDGSLPVMLRAFDRTWHTNAVGDALEMMAKGTTQSMLHEESGYSGLYDSRNGYVEVFFDDESSGTMQACSRRRANGHSLLVVMLGSHDGFDVELLLGAVRRAEETGPCGDGFLIYLCRGGDDAAGVQLEGDLEASDIHISVFRILKRTEIGSGHRPHRKLILYEFIDVCHATGGRTTGL